MTLDELLALRSRGELKRWGEWLDTPAGAAVRAALVARLRTSRVDVGDALDGRRLLRAARDRADAAQVRLNPIARDEAFVCVACGCDVPVGGRRPRDHCPRCLHSLHVDEVPGDRAADCGGLLVPVAVDASAKGWMIRYRCARCGIQRRNRVLLDVDPPDDEGAVRNLLVRAAGSG